MKHPEAKKIESPEERKVMKKFFNDLKLAKKMLLAPLVVFIFLIVIAGGTYKAISLQSSSIDDIYNNRFKGYQSSSQILVEMSTVQAKLYKIMNWIASNYEKQRVEALVKETDSQIAATAVFTKSILDSNKLMPEERKYYQLAYDNLIEFQKQVKAVLDIAAQDASTAVIPAASAAPILPHTPLKASVRPRLVAAAISIGMPTGW